MADTDGKCVWLKTKRFYFSLFSPKSEGYGVINMLLETVKKTLDGDPRLKNCRIEVSEQENQVIRLEGEADSWQHVVDAGHAAAAVPGVFNVVNDMTVPGFSIARPDRSADIAAAREKGVVAKADVVIIGAGISGCGIARELSKYPLSCIVVERGSDVADGATKANNGDIHPGHKAKPGTLKAKLNVKGNEMYTKWAEELQFALERCGALGVAYDEEGMKAQLKIYHDALENGVPGVRMVDADEIMKLEPNLKGKPIGGCYAPTMGLVEPFEVAVALAENAAENGVQFWLDTEVLDCDVENHAVKQVVTERGLIETKYIINCAGIYADEIARMVDDRFYTIHPRRGGIAIFDKRVRSKFKATVGTVAANKNVESKGGGLCHTPEGNILLGPSAVEVPDRECKGVYPEDLDYILQRADISEVDQRDIIAYYAGLRPADYKEDFIICMSGKVDGFVHVAGIQSPGIAAAPAVAEMVENIILDDCRKKGRTVERKADFQPVRKAVPKLRKLSYAERERLIAENPAYGRIICRCEGITEGEILEAIHSPVVPTTVDAIKRRTRAGMGRCQGGFCQPRVVELLARELGKDWTEICLKNRGSQILLNENRKAEVEQP